VILNAVLHCSFNNHLVDLPLLRNRQYVVNYPVQHQSGWEEKEHDGKNDGHI
jgi:hypothetical protein